MRKPPNLLAAALGLAGYAIVGFGGNAEAASLSILGGTAFSLNSAFNPSNTGSVPLDGLAIGQTVYVFNSTNTSPLGIYGLKWDSSTVKLTYTYVGYEAAYSNQADANLTYNSDFLFNNKTTPGGTSTTRTENTNTNGLIPFSFTSLAYSPKATAANGGIVNPKTAIAFYLVDATTAFALFEDIYKISEGSDRDFDDMVVKIEASPVPLPTALPLFASGLAGLGWLSRRRKRQAAE
jgi:hypothetical protein